MKKLIVAILISCTSNAYASDLKAGLWEVDQTRQILDGRDMTSQMSQAQAMMQQQISSLPPAQRARMQAMMSQSPGGGTKICISPAIAEKDTPIVDPEGRCKPTKFSRNGNKTSFEFNCTTNGRTMAGHGVSIAGNDGITTSLDMTETGSGGTHKMHSESRMKYLGPDCQGIAPPTSR